MSILFGALTILFNWYRGRHVRFWEPLTSFTLNEPVNVVITQLAFREPSAIFAAVTDVDMDS